ncbi:MAG: amidohydrolase family protein [Acidobacteria bacterium]|nr:amidohydrolase family protein [Acidobacteriota bacterium]
MDRRDFLRAAGAGIVGAALERRTVHAQAPEPIIDIHQHVGYTGRADDALIAHQRAMGATMTVLLPAGRPIASPSTHDGVANGLQAQCLGNEACYQLARAHTDAYTFAANEVPDLPDATAVIGGYLRRGAVMIAEQKFGVECDSPEMERIYRLAEEHHVPVLMHWQFQMYNYGFERFHRVLEKYPRVAFIGHAQTWWGHIDRNHTDQTVMYPKGPVARGGLTDRYLADYPNIYGDLSAGSGLNALTRDEAFTREFLVRHQDKLLFGSDCTDVAGTGSGCLGAQIIGAVRRLAADKRIERKLLYGNAKRVLRITSA